MTLSALLALLLLQSASVSDPAPTSLTAAAADFLAQSGAPGVGLAMACEGDDVRLGVAGVRISGRDAPITPGDLWHLGSNTKAMTATLAARLVEKDLVDWDLRLGEGLAGLDLDVHSELANSTLADLLTHRAGIMPNPGRMTALRLAGSDEDRDAQADRLIYARAVLAEPDGPRGDFLYSNAGYVLAAMLMEQATGEPYEALMAREVFEPLGLDTAGWGPPGTLGEADQPRGHRAGLFGGLGAREPDGRADNPPATNPAGRAHMNLADVITFLTAHRDRPADYLSDLSWERLQTPPPGEDYAYGWAVWSNGSLVHAGSNTMWYMLMRIDAETGCVAVGSANDGRDQSSDAVSAAVRALTP